MKIRLDAIVSSYEWEEDKRWRLNHPSCPAGEDTRSRLYIKGVVPSGSYVAHCFNCGGSGSFFKRGRYRSLSDILEEGKEGEYLGSDGTDSGIADLALTNGPIKDIRIKTWLYKYGMEESDWNALRLQENGQYGALVIPINEHSIQVRDFNGTWSAKYINYYAEKDGQRVYDRMCTGKEMIITEDVISAYRASKVLNMWGRACLGTSVVQCIKHINTHGTHVIFYIWFDGDTAGRQAALEAMRAIAPIIKGQVTVVLADKSPKEYTDEQLREAFLEGTKYFRRT